MRKVAPFAEADKIDCDMAGWDRRCAEAGTEFEINSGTAQGDMLIGVRSNDDVVPDKTGGWR